MEISLKRVIDGVQNMLTARGQEQMTLVDDSKGSVVYTTSTTIIYIPPLASDGKSFVKVNNEILKAIYFYITNSPCVHAILVCGALTPPVNDTIRNHKTYTIEVFNYRRMLFNPTKHYLVPKHEKLNDEECEKLLAVYKKTSLPTILNTDAIVTFYGWRCGDIIRITSKERIYYRTVRASIE